MKEFLKSHFKFIATGILGVIMAIWGQVKWDYAKSDAQMHLGAWVGGFGLAIAIGSILAVFLLVGKSKK